MTIALFGAEGQVGWALRRVAARRGIAVAAFGRAEADITDRTKIRAVLAGARADAVVNAAAYTAVDKAESDAATAFAVNRDGARIVAEEAARAGVPLIHISTDYVFDGAKAGFYVETDPVAPINVYGRSKEAGEAAVRGAGGPAAIARTSWVYGVEGANFVKTMLRLGKERPLLRIVADQHGLPTFADDLAEALLAIAARFAPGTFHVAGGGPPATWFAFAEAIFAATGGGPALERTTTAAFGAPAPRPLNSVLDCAKAERAFGIGLPPWRDGLRRMLAAAESH